MLPNLPQMKQNNSLLPVLSFLPICFPRWLALPGVQIDSFTRRWNAIAQSIKCHPETAAIVITIPITVMSLGLFLLIINAIIIGVADQWIDGLYVRSTWTAILFSFLISTISSWMFAKREQVVNPLDVQVPIAHQCQVFSASRRKLSVRSLR